MSRLALASAGKVGRRYFRDGASYFNSYEALLGTRPAYTQYPTSLLSHTTQSSSIAYLSAHIATMVIGIVPKVAFTPAQEGLGHEARSELAKRAELKRGEQPRLNKFAALCAIHNSASAAQPLNAAARDSTRAHDDYRASAAKLVSVRAANFHHGRARSVFMRGLRTVRPVAQRMGAHCTELMSSAHGTSMVPQPPCLCFGAGQGMASVLTLNCALPCLATPFPTSLLPRLRAAPAASRCPPRRCQLPLRAR